MSNQNDKIYLGWPNVNVGIGNIAGSINRSGLTYKDIYGIPRGGLLIATLLSYKLDIPMILDETEISDCTLICDDIVDSGKTIIDLQNRLLTENDIAALVNNECNACVDVTHFGINNYGNEWVVFPWDGDKDTVSQVTQENRDERSQE